MWNEEYSGNTWKGLGFRLNSEEYSGNTGSELIELAVQAVQVESGQSAVWSKGEKLHVHLEFLGLGLGFRLKSLCTYVLRVRVCVCAHLVMLCP